MSSFFSKKYASLEPYVPGEQPQDRKYLKLNTNESPFPPSPIAQRMARQVAGDLQLYSDPECKVLVNTATEVLNVNKDEIIFTNGSDEILNFAFAAFCDDEHPAVFPNITYGFYSVFAKYNNVPYEQIPLNDDLSINIEDYIGINKNIFIANPNAPTGVLLSVNDIEKIVSSNPDNIVVIDEAYIDFGGETAMPLTKKYKNLIVCQTFSKSRSLAGGRLGFAVADRSLIGDLNTIKYSTNPYNINTLTMYAGVGALLDKDYFENNSKLIQQSRDYTNTELKKLGFELTDSKANFVFAKHGKVKGKDIYLKLKENGVLIRHFDTPELTDYNRITIGSTEQMKTFIDKLSNVLKELSK